MNRHTDFHAPLLRSLRAAIPALSLLALAACGGSDAPPAVPTANGSTSGDSTGTTAGTTTGTTVTPGPSTAAVYPAPQTACEQLSEAQPTPKPIDIARVQYQGTTLVVDGTKYERVSPSMQGFVAGDLIAAPKKGTMAASAMLLKDLGLCVVTTYASIEMYGLKVPIGFERQWEVALRARPEIENAGVNSTGWSVSGTPAPSP